MNYLLVFATIEEAFATIDLLAARQSDKYQWLYEWDRGFLIITGIGSFASFAALSALSHEVDMICNFGLAGALHPTLELGKIYSISSCSKFLWHPKGAEAAKETAAFEVCSSVLLKAKDSLSLVSSDTPIYREKEVKELSENYDLVDMEGYAVAFFARLRHKPCQLYKIVSDYCNDSSSTLIKQGLKGHAEKIAQYVKINYSL